LAKLSFAGGGGERIRTDDLLLAKQALSQLSYTPRARDQKTAVGHQNFWSPMTDPWCLSGGPGRIWTSDLTLIKRAL
jgi:hypothetical protein